MKCSRCGFDIKENEFRCSNCGERVENMDGYYSRNTPPKEGASTVRNKVRHSNLKTFSMIVDVFKNPLKAVRDYSSSRYLSSGLLLIIIMSVVDALATTVYISSTMSYLPLMNYSYMGPTFGANCTLSFLAIAVIVFLFNLLLIYSAVLAGKCFRSHINHRELYGPAGCMNVILASGMILAYIFMNFLPAVALLVAIITSAACLTMMYEAYKKTTRLNGSRLFYSFIYSICIDFFFIYIVL